MTTIAWDGRYLAADGGSMLGNVRIPAVKVVRSEIRRRHPALPFAPGPALLAGCGNSGEVKALFRWLEGAGEEAHPAGEYHIIVVTRRGAWSIDPVLDVTFHGRSPIAIGAGGEMAMGALAMGANAAGAVDVVRKHGNPAWSFGRTVVLDSKYL